MADPGIGLDLVDIDRLERALERRPRLAERLFTPLELDYAAGHRRPTRHLAVRFAAKEAAIKALGSPVAPRLVEVTGGGDAPRGWLFTGGRPSSRPSAACGFRSPSPTRMTPPRRSSSRFPHGADIPEDLGGDFVATERCVVRRRGRRKWLF